MNRIGVCSWSLQPASPSDLAEKIRAVGVDCTQLALDSLRTGAWSVSDTLRELRAANIDILSGMMGMVGEDYSTLESIRRTGGVVPDETWPANLAAARENARVATELGIPLVTFHAGFVSERPIAAAKSLIALDSQNSELAKLIERLRQITDIFAKHSIRVAFETGQEHTEPLRQLLGVIDRRSVGVNFDPANIILYGVGDPISALRTLASKVAQLHIKDALPTRTTGEWGEEVPVGMGSVDWIAFAEVVDELLPDAALMIEREAGTQRVADARRALEVVSTAFFHHRIQSRRRRGPQ